MAIIKTYIGKDPNFKWKKCQVISKQGSKIEVLFSDEILGKAIGKVDEIDLI